MKLSAIDFTPKTGSFSGPGPLGTTPQTYVGNINKVISTSIGMISVVAFIWFTIQFLIASVEWISSGGDKAKVSGAKDKLTNAIIGLLLVVAAIFVTELVGRIFGIDILRPLNFVSSIW